MAPSRMFPSFATPAFIRSLALTLSHPSLTPFISYPSPRAGTAVKPPNPRIPPFMSCRTYPPTQILQDLYPDFSVASGVLSHQPLRWVFLIKCPLLQKRPGDSYNLVNFLFVLFLDSPFSMVRYLTSHFPFRIVFYNLEMRFPSFR